MTACSEPAKSICLVNENAQCNPIWVALPQGLKLAHFPTFQVESSGGEVGPADASYERCERTCLQAGCL